MDEFKVEHFNRENPAERFPAHRSLSLEECADIKKRLSNRLKLEVTSSSDKLMKSLNAASRMLQCISMETETLDLRKLLGELKIVPESEIFINWHKFDSIDQFLVDDVSKYFGYLWYPSSDDIEIFDTTLMWVLSISHSGDIKISNLKSI